MKYTQLLLASVIAIVFISGCSLYGGTTPTNQTTPGTNSVAIQNFAFSPQTITVSAGTTVTWTNQDSVAHTVTSDTGAFDSGQIASGGTFSNTFNQAGTYTYHCTVHPSMKATVVVK